MLIESAAIAALGDDAYRDFSDLPDQVDPDEELARRQQLIDDRSAAQWAMISLDSGLVCGLLELTVVPGEDWIRLGYSTVEGERGRGHATEALRLVTDWVMEETEAERIELCIDPENGASIRVAQKAGYEHRGRVLNMPPVGRAPEAELYVWLRS
jgi:RimJ/RimL family protein N-acetyltransferase